MRVDSSFREFNLLGPPRFLTSSPEFRHVSFARTHKKSEPSPPAILRIQIPDPRTPSQTCLTPPFPSQADFAPRSATRESHPAVPAGPRPVDPPRPTPLRSSACARHFSKDGQLPYRAPPHYRPDECRVRILAQLRTSSARGTSGRPGRSGGGLAHLSPKGDTPAREKETPGEEQLAAGSWQGAEDAKRRARSATSAGVGRYAPCAWRQAMLAGGSRYKAKGKAQSAERQGQRGSDAMRQASPAAGSWQAAAGGEQRRTAPNAEC